MSASADEFVLAIDQGSTGTTAAVVDSATHEIVALSRQALDTEYPQPGWAQQDADEIWQTTVEAIDGCMRLAPGVTPASIVLTNQRETAVAWDRRTGAPLGPVLVWADTRTASMCAEWAATAGKFVLSRTGLALDTLYSGPKMRWLLDHAVSSGTPMEHICLGTVDSWLIWNLTGAFVIEAGNAARTLLLDSEHLDWSDSLLEVCGIPRSCLPAVRASNGEYGVTRAQGRLQEGTPLTAVLADSHASMYFHGCTAPGTGKATYKAGCSVMTPVDSFEQAPRGIVSALSWLTDLPTYAREGNALSTGTLLQWVGEFVGRSALSPGDPYVTELALRVPDTGGVMLVPAFAGLGAPYWDRDATTIMTGMTTTTSPAHMARAALEAVAHQVTDIVEAMESDGGSHIDQLQADGDWAGSSLLMQMQADLLGRPVRVVDEREAALLGVALFAARARRAPQRLSGLVPSHRARVFEPAMDTHERAQRRSQWADAVQRSRGQAVHPR